MSTWLHCNLCFKLFSKSVAFSFTNCGHIYCNDCFKKGTDPCHVCQKRCKVISLNEKLDINLQSYFSSPKQAIKKCVEVLDFQEKHRKRLMEHLYRKSERQSQMFRKADEVINTQHEEIRKLKYENKCLKKYIISFKAHSEGQGAHRPTTPSQLYTLTDSPDSMSPRCFSSSMKARPMNRGAGDGQFGIMTSPSLPLTPRTQFNLNTIPHYREKQNSSGPKRLSIAPKPVDGKIYTPSPKKHPLRSQGVSGDEMMSSSSPQTAAAYPKKSTPKSHTFTVGGLRSVNPTPPPTPSLFSRLPSACPSPLIRFEKGSRTAWQ